MTERCYDADIFERLKKMFSYDKILVVDATIGQQFADQLLFSIDIGKKDEK